MDTRIKEALTAIYRERDRLGTASYLARPPRDHSNPLGLPKRNFKQKIQKVLNSPHRWQLIGGLVAALMGRVKVLAYLRVLITFPALITRLQTQVEALEFQLADQRVKLLQLSKSLDKK